MTKALEGKTILVTGATSGIGRATAIAIVKAGGRVAFTGRRDDKGKDLERELNAIAPNAALFIKADHANEADSKNAVEKAVSHFGSLHGAFNNAGIEGTGAPTHEENFDNYRKVFDVNVWGVLNSMKHEIPAILKAGGGSIVNTTSTLGKVAVPGAGVYSASKHAVEGLTKAAALELADKGVRVNNLAPGGVKTEMSDRFTGGTAEGMNHLASQHPIGRVGEADEIAHAAVFLLSDHSSFITGETIGVNGGFLAR